MEMLSKEYGWTPTQIRSESYEDLMEYVAILKNRRAIEKADQLKHSRKHG